ncbi:DUF3322 domain-containing protein [Scandinavium sp. H11S7]|uniref:DUF3322 domain-containing protein n=1 Tax=Scandinavium hiltneri TaxID=2926519 RepID=UPI0021651109|nr:DUF3322 domain-containing protein [Scandinavium hiltneri]MCS2157697.1 DUF3322 domain-containing protein [Scandinavium hiltneri]
MAWTTPEDLHAQLQRLWNKGTLLRELAQCSDIFPLQLSLKKPSSGDLSLRFNDVRLWITELKKAEQKGYSVEWKVIRHRVIGTNSLPTKIRVDSVTVAIKLLGVKHQAATYEQLIRIVSDAQPTLLPWLIKYPHCVLEQAQNWPQFLSIILWLQNHPRPNVYLRQIDLPNVNSKFIEQHRGVLGELFELALPPEAIDLHARGVQQFNRRFGFREKPLRVRYRLSNEETGDNEIDSRTFSTLSPSVNAIFVIENEISYLDFPAPAGAMVIFGRGYGFDMLSAARWMQSKILYYWGDIDTHGFAILNQFRQIFPRTRSLLMDEATLLAHRQSWGHEEKPCLRQLAALTENEKQLCVALTEFQPGRNIRLEQEHITKSWILKAVENC